MRPSERLVGLLAYLRTGGTLEVLLLVSVRLTALDSLSKSYITPTEMLKGIDFRVKVGERLKV